MSDQNFALCKAAMIAGPGSGQGKTIFTASLARKLTLEGKSVRVFKVGPDYLDPTILECASGQAVYNLDLWMMGENHCQALLSKAAMESDVILVESMMGLHDNQPSNAQLANLFGLPIILIMNVAKFAQTASAVVEGMSSYAEGANIVRVIGNRVASNNHHHLLEENLGEIYGGSVRRDPRFEIPQRHLGLVQAQEIAELDGLLNQSAQALSEFDITVSIPEVRFECKAGQVFAEKLLDGKTIAIAKDAAFSFIYPANVDLLIGMGAKIKFFSPLNNEAVPQCDGLWLPGGYPELHGDQLSRADRTIKTIKHHHNAGKPVLAECGGMIFMCEEMIDVAGKSTNGCGVFSAQCQMAQRFQSVGLQFIDVDNGSGSIKGHSFHHGKLSTQLNPVYFAEKQNGEEGEPEYCIGNTRLTFLHRYFPSNPLAAAALFI